MMMLDYKGGKGVKNLGKSDYVISDQTKLYFFYLNFFDFM